MLRKRVERLESTARKAENIASLNGSGDHNTI